jgi:hypothetical protein
MKKVLLNAVVCALLSVQCDIYNKPLVTPKQNYDGSIDKIEIVPYPWPNIFYDDEELPSTPAEWEELCNFQVIGSSDSKERREIPPENIEIRVPDSSSEEGRRIIKVVYDDEKNGEIEAEFNISILDRKTEWYAITLDESIGMKSGGIVIPYPSTAEEGALVTLHVYPKSGYILVPESLIYSPTPPPPPTYSSDEFKTAAGGSFTMPAYNVTLKAKFDKKPEGLPLPEEPRGITRFVAVAYDSSAAAYSADGEKWEPMNLPGDVGWSSVTYGGGKFVAVAENSSTAAYSEDGTTWTQATLPGSIAKWRSVTYGGDKFVAVAENSNIAVYSFDGESWEGSAIMPGGTRIFYGVTYGGGNFVAVCYSPAAAFSVNGITWTQADLSRNEMWSSVTYGGDKFVTVAYDSSATAYSADGMSWYLMILPFSARWSSVTHGNGKFVAVAYDSSAAAYSTDGITWNPTTLPSDSAKWSSVTYGYGKFVAVAENSNKAAYSEDGTTWTQATLPGSIAKWRSVTYRGDLDWESATEP